MILEGIYDTASLQSGIQTSNLDSLLNNNRVDIAATSAAGVSGQINITGDINFLQNALANLSTVFTKPEQVIAGSCLARRNVNRNRFVVTGSGGLPPSPYEAINQPYNLIEVQPLEASSTEIESATPVPDSLQQEWQMGDAIEEAQGLYATADGRIMLGRATPPASTSVSELLCQ